MADSTSFLHFQCFPKEIQDMIWSQSLTPQLISLRLEVYTFTPQNTPSFMFLLGGDGPLSHFTMEQPLRPSSPYFTAHLVPVDYSPPAALSVCRDSRQRAIAKGYRPWRVEHRNGKSRDLMWNPSEDTVRFVDADADGRHSFLLFLKQFPVQAKEVTRLSLRESFWPWPIVDPLFFNEQLWCPLMKFKSLRVLFILPEKEGWDTAAETEHRRGDEMGGWREPEGVERSLIGAREVHQEREQGFHNPYPTEVPRVCIADRLEVLLRGEG